MSIKSKTLSLLLLLILVALFQGDTPPMQALNQAFLKLTGNTERWSPLLEERLPRTVILLCSGASLALSGVIVQALFQNPLASPSSLGITSGGSLLVFICFALGAHHSFPFLIPLSAFSGSLLSLLLIYFLAKREGRAGLENVILTGIALSTLFVAVIAIITYSLRDNWELMQTLTEWQAGSSNDMSFKHVHLQMPLTIIGLMIALFHSKELDILALGDMEALSLGVDVERVRFRLFLAVALLTGASLATLGVISFFGLILPHLLRRLLGASSSSLIPYSILVGATTMLAMDVFLRILAFEMLTLGNVSAILGGVFFIYLLFSRKPVETYA